MKAAEHQQRPSLNFALITQTAKLAIERFLHMRLPVDAGRLFYDSKT